MRWIALAGYMAVGKSTVGEGLAARLSRPFVDSDAVIEERAALSIPQIFTDKGELWFRRSEERVIRDVLGEEPGVLALGGGALTSERTRDLLARRARVVWLRLSTERLWERAAGTARPLAVDEARFRRRYVAREPTYREAADLTVDADRSVSEIVDRICAWVDTVEGAGAPS